MYERYLKKKVEQLAAGFPAVLVTGPRQSGKTTLIRHLFPNNAYVSLEKSDELDLARSDPQGFLRKYPPPCILDEIQRAPALLSYIQGYIDNDPTPGHWILTGSQQLLLMSQVTQTLAGRIAIVDLFPLSIGELHGLPPEDPVQALLQMSHIPKPTCTLTEAIYQGFYPRVHAAKLDPQDWYAAYYRTYVERDVRDLLNIGDLGTFRKFVRLCAGRTGQLLNLSSLAVDTGISHPTARSWLSALEASFLVMLLPSYHKNFNKRLVKTPKLYFLDTGLLCYLLGLRDHTDLEVHPFKGAIFETFVVSGIYKLFSHHGEKPPLYFWRDHSGHEVDLLVDLGVKYIPIEIKSAQTVIPEFFRDLKWWLDLSQTQETVGGLCYGGEEAYSREGFTIHPWWHF